MSRTTFAAALATAILSLAAVNAAAAPAGSIVDKSKLYRTVTLQCAVGELDGVSLKGNMVMLTNTSGIEIPKGAMIKVSYFTGSGRPVLLGKTDASYRHINGKDALSWGKTPTGAARCVASVKVSLITKNTAGR